MLARGTREGSDTRPTPAIMWRSFEIAPDIVLAVYCWREKSGGADFHARYLLTERGGIGIDAGFSAEGEHQSTDMHLMSLVLSVARLNAFTRDATDFELMAPVLEIRADGTVHRK